MKKSTKREVRFFLLLGGFILFMWTVPSYLSDNPAPIDCFFFKRAVSNGYIKVISKDSVMWGHEEEVIMEDVRTGFRYTIDHHFYEHTEFYEPTEEHYEHLKDENGKSISYKGDDEEILNLINNKK